MIFSGVKKIFGVVNFFFIFVIFKKMSFLSQIIDICKRDDEDSFMELFADGMPIDFICPKAPFATPDIIRDSPPICCVAAFFKAVKCLSYLIANSCNMSLCDKKKRNIIHFACAGGSIEIIELLLSMQLDWNLLDTNGNTCIHYAISYHNADILYLLWCCKNIDLSAINARKNTFLHLATACEDIDIIEFLCKNGCNVNSKNDRGLTPLHLAASKPNISVVSTLINYGADSEIADNTGLLPYQYANYAGYQHICGYLLSC